MTARCDAKNAQALKRLFAGGTRLRAHPRTAMVAPHEATEDTLDDVAEKNVEFAKQRPSRRRFRDDRNAWFRVAEITPYGYRYGDTAAR